MPDPVLSCRNLDVAIGALRLVTDLKLDLRRGEFVCIIGCNGAGKTTLLHTLAGLRDRVVDGIELDGRPLEGLSRTAIARQVALLAQRQDDAFPTTALEAVLLGRHPHLGFFEWESQEDLEIALGALASLDLSNLAGRDIATLSGGERQRVALATVLTQQPSLYLLDEPLNNLDPHHQLGVLRLFRQLTDDGNTTVAILHDLNLVSRFADRVLLLFGPDSDGDWLYGGIDDCMTPANLTRLYNTAIQRIRHDGNTLFVAA